MFVHGLFALSDLLRLLSPDDDGGGGGGGDGDGDGGGGGDDGGDGDGDGDRWKKGDNVFEKIKIERRRAQREARDWQRKFEELQATVQSLEDDKSKAEGRLDDLLASKDKRIEKLTEELHGANERLAAIDTGKRKGELIEALEAKTTLPSRRLRAMLLLAKEEKDLDIAPEEVTSGVVNDATKVLRELFPEDFGKVKTSGGSRGAPGVNRKHLRDGEGDLADDDDYIDRMAKKYSHRSPRELLAERRKAKEG